MTYVGIDVSKTTFVVAYSPAKTGKTKTFKNTVKGIREFIQTISQAEHHCVLEATGNYSAYFSQNVFTEKRPDWDSSTTQLNQSPHPVVALACGMQKKYRHAGDN